MWSARVQECYWREKSDEKWRRAGAATAKGKKAGLRLRILLVATFRPFRLFIFGGRNFTFFTINQSEENVQGNLKVHMRSLKEDILVKNEKKKFII